MKDIREPWTNEQDDFLRGQFRHLTTEELAKYLGRTSFSISKRLRQLGCKRSVKERLDLANRAQMLAGAGVWANGGDELMQAKRVLDKILTTEAEMVRWGKVLAESAPFVKAGHESFDTKIARQRFAELRCRLRQLEADYYKIIPEADLTAFELTHPLLD